MTEDVRNAQEQAVISAVLQAAPNYPAIAEDQGLLADVVCVALNELPPRYIRHAEDFFFFLTPDDRAKNDRAVRWAVHSALLFVNSRLDRRS